MAELFGRAVRKACRPGAVGGDTPHVELVVEQHRVVIFRPAGDSECRLLLDRRVGFAVDERGRDGFRDVDGARVAVSIVQN